MIPLRTYVDLSVKKTLWEMGYVRVGSGSIHSMWEDPDTSRKILIKWEIATERHKTQEFTIGQQNEERFKFSSTQYLPVHTLNHELDVDNLETLLCMVFCI